MEKEAMMMTKKTEDHEGNALEAEIARHWR